MPRYVNIIHSLVQHISGNDKTEKSVRRGKISDDKDGTVEEHAALDDQIEWINKII